MFVLCVLVYMVPFVWNTMVIGETVTSKLSVPCELVVGKEILDNTRCKHAHTFEGSVNKRIAVNLDIRYTCNILVSSRLLKKYTVQFERIAILPPVELIFRDYRENTSVEDILEEL